VPALPDPSLLAPIEAQFWTPHGVTPPEASAVVRGSPISGGKFLEHATRQAREYSLRGRNMASLSVDLVLLDWPLGRILREQLSTYRRFAAVPLGVLIAEGFEILATGARPHADVVLPGLDIVEADRLAAIFAPHEERNRPEGGDR